jgi:protein TonB
MRAWLFAVLAALVLHAAILLFGGVFFMKPEEGPATVVEEVDLMTADEEQQSETEEVARQEPEVAVEQEAPPEMADIDEPSSTIEPTDVVARLEALSLGALEDALAPGAGDEFGGGVSLASGGRIGGTGEPGAVGSLEEASSDAAFDIGALDQGPRVLHQVPPVYPPELRKRKLEGTVYVVLFVDRDGRVVQPVVESSPHEAFNAPALEAVRRWRFEPAVAHGEKVRSKVRYPIRFVTSG